MPALPSPFIEFRRSTCFLVAAALLAATRLAAGQEPAPPPPATPAADRRLPDLAPFLLEVRQRLHSDEFLLDQYTFLEKHVERQLDSKGAVTRTKTATFEVYPSLEPGHTYRRLVEKDGRPLTPEELAAEDRKHEKKIGDETTPEAEAKRAARLQEVRRREESAVSQLFAIYDIAIAGREMLDGRSTILLTFRPKPGVVPTGRAGKILKTFAGRAWIDEEDRQLARVDAELVDTLSFGLGILARLHKGSRASIVRRKINDEIWLPAEARFAGSARLMLVKGIRMEAASEYSDYRKFQVATSSEFAPEETPAKPDPDSIERKNEPPPSSPPERHAP